MKLIATYQKIRKEIEQRLHEFKQTWRSGDEAIFCELAFCLLTPQSKAKVCWEVIEKLRDSRILFSGGEQEIARFLYPVRFWRKKAKYIVEARKKFESSGKLAIKAKLSVFLGKAEEAREYLVREIKGIGYKEASHFLRNIGFGEDLAILDRHILRSLKELGVINEIPKTLTRKRYLDIERRMREFSMKVGIPMSQLDFVLWYLKTGEVFK